MKVCTITTHASDNYGAVLQAYALSTYVNTLVPSEILNYVPAYAKEKYRVKRKIRSLKSLLYYGYDVRHQSDRTRRKERFSSFRDSYLNLTEEYATTEELAEASSRYDAVIAGSDQIWNPVLHQFDSNYFLTFCRENVKKYGYAPSFGLAQLTERQEKMVRVRCEGFSDIAFREQSGIDIARKLFQRDFPLVLDPVFLLDKAAWERIVPDTAPKEKYYLCYYLSDPRDSVRHICRMAKKDNAKVYSIGYSLKDIENSATKVYDLGPLEFLSYLYHAECVFTDSFHATAFSLIFNKPFYTRVDGKNAKRADRVLTLIDSVGLQDRAYAETQLHTLSADGLDYTAADCLLEKHVNESRAYVKSVADDIKGGQQTPLHTVSLDKLTAYGGYIKDPSALVKSSSGGFAAAMAQTYLQKNGVVYGVAYTGDFRGAEYIRCDSQSRVEALLGSKYIKSTGVTKDIIEKVKADLSERRNVLFIGLPCEIAALITCLERDHVSYRDCLLTVDLICHGPTYPKVQEEYIDALEKKYHARVTGFSVRYKNPDWSPSYLYAEFENGQKYIREFAYTDMGEAFQKMPMKGCLSCRFKGDHHRADITIGDFWGIPRKNAAYNRKGVSVALVRTEVGKRLLEEMDNIMLFDADAGFIIEHNLNYAFSAEKPKDYDAFCEDYKTIGLHKTCVKHYSRKKKMLMRVPPAIMKAVKKCKGWMI